MSSEIADFLYDKDEKICFCFWLIILFLRFESEGEDSEEEEKMLDKHEKPEPLSAFIHSTRF